MDGAAWRKLLRDNRLGVGTTVVIAAVHATWILRGASAPQWDEADYLGRSFALWRQLWEQPFANFATSLLTISPVKPPGVLLLPFPAFFVFGPSVGAALWTLWGCLLAFNLVYVDFLRRHYGACRAVLGLTLLNCAPSLLGASRSYFIELPLMLVTFLLFVDVYASVGLTQRRGRITTWLAAGFLLKQSFVLSALGVFGLHVWQHRRDLPAYLRRLTNVGIIPGLILAAWVVANGRAMLGFLRTILLPIPEDGLDASLDAIHTVGHFPVLMINEGTGFFPFAVTLLLAAALLFARRGRVGGPRPEHVTAALIVCAVVVGTIWFLLKFKLPRYALPALPFIVILLLHLWSELDALARARPGLAATRRWISRLVALCTAGAILQAANLTTWAVDPPSVHLGPLHVFERHVPGVSRWGGPRYPIDELFATIEEHAGHEPRRVALLFDSPHLNIFSANMTKELRGSRLVFDTAAYMFSTEPHVLLHWARSFDYLVLSPGQTDPAHTNLHTRARSELLRSQGFLELVRTVPTADGQGLEIYFNPRPD